MARTDARIIVSIVSIGPDLVHLAANRSHARSFRGHRSMGSPRSGAGTSSSPPPNHRAVAASITEQLAFGAPRAGAGCKPGDQPCVSGEERAGEDSMRIEVYDIRPPRLQSALAGLPDTHLDLAMPRRHGHVPERSRPFVKPVELHNLASSTSARARRAGAARSAGALPLVPVDWGELGHLE